MPYLIALGALFLLVAVSGATGALAVGLSARRVQALEIVKEVVPSQYPDTRFAKLGFDPTDPKYPAGTTSCGALPGYVGHHLGDPNGITRYGVEGVRIEGIAKGAWVPWKRGRLPKPGDIFGTARSPEGIIVHVGIIIEVHGELWVTADAGQGPTAQPSAAYVQRVYDERTGTLSRVDNGEPRYVAGWIDLDAWPFPKTTAKGRKGGSWVYPPSQCDGAECAAVLRA